MHPLCDSWTTGEFVSIPPAPISHALLPSGLRVFPHGERTTPGHVAEVGPQRPRALHEPEVHRIKCELIARLERSAMLDEFVAVPGVEREPVDDKSQSNK